MGMDRKIEKKKWTTKRIASVGAISLLGLFIVYTFVFGDYSSKLNVKRERITISTVEYEPFQEYIAITGAVMPIETFYLDITEGGRVMEKYVEEGAHLIKGEPIIKLDNARLTLDVIYNEANVFQQINSLRSTRLMMEQSRLNLKGSLLDLNHSIADQKRIYETSKGLFEKKLISKNEFEKEKDRYEYLVEKKTLTLESFRTDSLFRNNQISQLERSVEQLQQNLTFTKRQLENLTVKAPISGQLTSLNAEIGESISSGENLGQIDNIDSFKVRAAIDEHFIARVKPGQYGEFTFAGNTYRLKIRTVYPEVNNGRFEVDMLFTGKTPDGIRRGQTVHIKLELSELFEAVVVPRGGFYQTTGGQWIFILNEEGTEAVKTQIRLGRQNSQVFEVLEGLKKGDQVVTSSYENFGDNEKLIIQ